MSPVLKRTLQVVVAAALLGGGAWFVMTRPRGEARAAGRRDGGNPDRVVPVVVAQTTRRDVPVYLDGLGNVAAFATVTVRAQVEGRLERVHFKEGQEVKQGDVLAEIDPRPFQIQLQAAAAALARDKALLEGNNRNLDRFKALGKDGLASQQQIDDQNTSIAQTQGTLRGDQTQIASARLQLDYARITAPISGVTGLRLVDAGNVIKPSDANGLVVITQIEPIAVLFTLPQDDLPAIAKALADGEVTVDAYGRDGSKRIAQGKLELVDNQINPATASIKLKAVFPNEDRALWPNQLVKTRLLLTTKEGALVVPTPVVQRGPQGTFAYVVGPEKKVSPRPIQIEATQGEWSLVGSGLEEGETVVVDGQYQLRPGSKVAPREPGQDGAASGSKHEKGAAGHQPSSHPSATAAPSQ